MGSRRPLSAVRRSVQSYYLRQIGTSRVTDSAQVHRLLARAVGRDLVGPSEQFGVDAVASDQRVEVVPSSLAALFALNVEHVELADQVSRKRLL